MIKNQDDDGDLTPKTIKNSPKYKAIVIAFIVLTPHN